MEAAALSSPVRIASRSISLPATLLRLRSDDQLVALFRGGSDEAFSVIHERYRPRLMAYCRQMVGSHADAEDVLQDVFVRAHAALRAGDQPIALRAWLYRIAHNRCVDGLRRPAPMPSEIMPGAQPALSRGAHHDPPVEAERSEDLARLVRDLLALPEQQRSALLLRELQGLTYEELAVCLGVSVGAVKSLLVRARDGLATAAGARDAPCAEIRLALAAAHDRGVRPDGRARRHLRECAGCREHRVELRRTSRQLAALAPPAGLLAQLGLVGGGGGGLAAAGGGGAGGGLAGGGAALCGAAGAAMGKVAAIVCAAALVGGAGVALTPAPAAGLHPRAAAVHRARPVRLVAAHPAAPALRRPAPGPAVAPAALAPPAPAPAAAPACPPAPGAAAVAPPVAAPSPSPSPSITVPPSQPDPTAPAGDPAAAGAPTSATAAASPPEAAGAARATASSAAPAPAPAPAPSPAAGAPAPTTATAASPPGPASAAAAGVPATCAVPAPVPSAAEADPAASASPAAAAEPAASSPTGTLPAAATSPAGPASPTATAAAAASVPPTAAVAP